MQIGMIGLGRMGSNMVRRLLRAGHSLVVFDRSSAAVQALAAEGAVGATSLADFVGRLAPPRVVCAMIPVALVDSLLDELAPLLQPEDAVIDGGYAGLYEGRAEIAQLPEKIALLGGGYWRHHLSNVMFSRTNLAREMEINAYCLTTDWRKEGALVHCSDFRAILKDRCHWQIHNLALTPVAQTCASKSAEDLARGQYGGSPETANLHSARKDRERQLAMSLR